MGIFSKLFRRNTEQLHADWLVIGLGNPGAQYERNRHNVGYMGVDKLLDGPLMAYPGGAPALMRIQNLVGKRVAFVRSTTYMNLSGEAVSPLVQRLHIPLERVIVLHDELDLPAGRVRIKSGGNENGHNGLKSITQHLGTREYLRVRMGIGRPAAGVAVPDYVLSDIDAPTATDLADTAARAVALIVSEGVAQAQQEIHRK
ncbi:aminoacyl-tRNA hydrolase [Corynebacterium gerontici]|uniref:Peptidyl-tRNA hydrolase n=1 Tax=Corynebacterium gerontici TaxID=2079234 RepID=A0A3G6IZ47_9CORY|nr:Peptidyl-tRNA hydrolase [Corynebacterium gerontici]